MDLDFIASFDLSRFSKIGHKWPFFFTKRQISRSQGSRRIPPLFAVSLKQIQLLCYFLVELGEERERDKRQNMLRHVSLVGFVTLLLFEVLSDWSI